jgi:hypothetical protein
VINDSRSILGLLYEIEDTNSQYYRFVPTDENRGNRLEQLIKRAHNRLYFRSGELNPRIWNDIPKIINDLKEFLQNKKHVVEFTFTKRFDVDKVDKKIPEKDVIQKLEEENPEIVTLAKEHPDQVKLHFLPTRLSQHCQINDNGDIIFEELEHAEKGSPWVDVVFNHKSLSSKWINRFSDSLNNPEVMEISFV